MHSLLGFIQQGGYVLWSIVFTTLLLWWLIIDRYLFLYFNFPKLLNDYSDIWRHEQPTSRWQALARRNYFISRAEIKLKQNLFVIKALTSVLPMLGLLGTVSGMINTFDVMSIFGTGNIRGMSQGISQALITTMAGLLAALSGYYFVQHLEEKTDAKKQLLNDALSLDELNNA